MCLLIEPMICPGLMSPHAIATAIVAEAILQCKTLACDGAGSRFHLHKKSPVRSIAEQ
jgi:hypothetical protein